MKTTDRTRYVPCGFIILGLLILAGCHRPPPTRIAAPVLGTPPGANLPRPPQEPLPQEKDREQLTAQILERFQQRLMGRRVELQEVQQVATQIRPIVEAAARQPEAQSGLQQMAADQGLSFEEARAHWIDLQEADLLLEAGGDPDAVSTSNAVGAAQWLAGTGQGNGLIVNLKESQRLSAKINALRLQIAWRNYLLRLGADPAAPGAPSLTRTEAAAQLPALRSELEMLRAKRRSADERYDPQKAIFAQTRYLLRIYPRFPAPDWLFQAYHGGEGGVKKTLHLYLGRSDTRSAAEAIQRGNGGAPLTFEEVYFTATPRSHSEAFSYLYGRSDDHRHYWWKLRAAQDLLARYRRDPKAFQAEWEAGWPGRMREVRWYAGETANALPDLPALQAAQNQRRLVPVTDGLDFTMRPAPDDLTQARWYAVLRPEALGALRLVATAYRQVGGEGRLQTGDLTLTQAYLAQSKALHPPTPPKPPLWPPDPDVRVLIGGGPPAAFDLHTTGLAFDLLRPVDQKQRKILEYTLQYFENLQILSVVDARDRKERRYHLVPNPRYADALTQIATSGKTPPLPGL